MILAIHRPKGYLAVRHVNRHRIVGAVRREITAGRKRHQHQAKRSFLYESPSSPVPLRQKLTVDYEFILRQVMD